MSQKNFKRARQLARKMTQGAPLNGLVGKKVTNKYKREVWIALVAPGTTRHVYKQIKKLMRRGISLVDIQNSIVQAGHAV